MQLVNQIELENGRGEGESCNWLIKFNERACILFHVLVMKTEFPHSCCEKASTENMRFSKNLVTLKTSQVKN